MNDSYSNTDTQKITKVDSDITLGHMEAELKRQISELPKGSPEWMGKIEELNRIQFKQMAEESRNKASAPVIASNSAAIQKGEKLDHRIKSDDDNGEKPLFFENIPMKWRIVGTMGAAAVMIAAGALAKTHLWDQKPKDQPKVEKKETPPPAPTPEAQEEQKDENLSPEQQAAFDAMDKENDKNRNAKESILESEEELVSSVSVISHDISDEQQKKIDFAYIQFEKDMLLLRAKLSKKVRSIRSSEPDMVKAERSSKIASFENDKEQIGRYKKLENDVKTITGGETPFISIDDIGKPPFSFISEREDVQKQRNEADKHLTDFMNRIEVSSKNWNTIDDKKLLELGKERLKAADSIQKLLPFIKDVNKDKEVVIDMIRFTIDDKADKTHPRIERFVKEKEKRNIEVLKKEKSEKGLSSQ